MFTNHEVSKTPLFKGFVRFLYTIVYDKFKVVYKCIQLERNKNGKESLVNKSK